MVGGGGGSAPNAGSGSTSGSARRSSARRRKKRRRKHHKSKAKKGSKKSGSKPGKPAKKGSSKKPRGHSRHPVQYGTGRLLYAVTDLSSMAFGMPWGHTRNYANLLDENNVGINGNSWLVNQLVTLAFIDADPGDNDPEQICLVDSAAWSQWYQRQLDGSYRPEFQGQTSLVREAATSEFVLTDARGVRTTFFDNSLSQPVLLRGMFKGRIDANGRKVTAAYEDDSRISSFVQGGPAPGLDNGFYYTYYPAGPSEGRISSVLLQVRGQAVRRTSYIY